MDAFIAMRKYISSNLIEQKNIYNQVLKNTEDIKLLQESFQKFEEKKKINEIYFNGQIFDNTFHDRYFILDNIQVYHCRASINRIGYKTFSITKINDTYICNLLVNKINERINFSDASVKYQKC